MAPPPSGEFSIVLRKSFDAPLAEKIEFVGEPNRPSNVTVTKHIGKDMQIVETKTGQIQADDVQELLALVEQLSGFPANPSKDAYGFDMRLTLTTFQIQWDNGEGIEGESAGEPTEENKQTFKDVTDSIQALARQSAK